MCVGGGVNTPSLMPGEGCQAASGSALDRHRGRKKEMKKEREEDSMGGRGREGGSGVPCPWVRK